MNTMYNAGRSSANILLWPIYYYITNTCYSYHHFKFTHHLWGIWHTNYIYTISTVTNPFTWVIKNKLIHLLKSMYMVHVPHTCFMGFTIVRQQPSAKVSDNNHHPIQCYYLWYYFTLAIKRHSNRMWSNRTTMATGPSYLATQCHQGIHYLTLCIMMKREIKIHFQRKDH